MAQQARQEGKLWVKCAYHYTDDYAHDAANNNGAMPEYLKVYVRADFSHPLEAEIDAAYDKSRRPPGEVYSAQKIHTEVEPKMSELRRLREEHDRIERGKARGMIMIWPREFKNKSGHVSGDEHKGSFAVHGNLVYDYLIREDGEFEVGDVVRFKNPSPSEANSRFEITEWNGDRGFAKYICDLPIPPVSLVRANEIEFCNSR